MTAVLVALAGIALLVWFAVLIGTSLDTEGQRREWKRLADERRRYREERLGVGFVARRCDPDSLCDGCPFR